MTDSSKWTFLICFFFLAAASSIAPVLLHAQISPRDVVTVAIEKGVGDWAMQESSGRVFCSIPTESAVVEYDSSGNEVRKFEIGETPTELLLKHDRLVVACQKTTALYVIDLESNKILGKIAVDEDGPYGLFCSEIDNGFVYCICKKGFRDIIQIDLKAMKIRKQISTRGMKLYRSGLSHSAMSRDGRWVVSEPRTFFLHRGSDLINVDEEEMTFVKVRSYDESLNQAVVNPLDRYWAFREDIYSLDLSRLVRSFPGGPVAIHPKLDFAASRTTDGIALGRFSDAQTIVDVPLPERSTRDKRRQKKTLATAYSTVKFDLKSNVVFVGDPYQASWVPFGKLKNLSPLKLIVGPTRHVSTIGKEIRILIKVTNSDDLNKLVITDGPQAASIEDGVFVWRPQKGDLGFHKITFAVKSEKADEKFLDELQLNVQVTLPKVQLGFQGRLMKLSPNNRYLLVWGPVTEEGVRRSSHQTGADEIMVYDIQERKVLAQKTLPQGIRLAAIDDKYVFIASNSGNLFYRFSLELKNASQMFLKWPPKSLVKISPNVLLSSGKVSVTDYRTAKSQAFNVQTMKPFPVNEILGDHGDRQIAKPLSHNEVLFGNKVFDSSTGKAIRIEGFAHLPSLIDDRQLRSSYYSRMSKTGSDVNPLRWGRRCSKGRLFNHRYNQIGRVPEVKTGFISKNKPLFIGITQAYDHEFTTTKMHVANLRDGTVEQTSIIQISGAPSQSDTSNLREMLLETDNEIVLLLGAEVLFIDSSLITVPSKEIPLHFIRQMPQEIEVGGSVKVQIPVGGKLEGATFNLGQDNPSISLNSETGELTIDTNSLWKSFIDPETNSSGGNRTRGLDYLTQPQMNHEVNAKAYKLLTGKNLKAGRLATQLSMSATLVDAEGFEDVIEFSLVVVGPRTELDEKVAAAKQNFLKARQDKRDEYARLQTAKQKAKEQRARLATKTETSGKANSTRIQEMENRVRRLETALDTILRHLDEN